MLRPDTKLTAILRARVVAHNLHSLSLVVYEACIRHRELARGVPRYLLAVGLAHLVEEGGTATHRSGAVNKPLEQLAPLREARVGDDECLSHILREPRAHAREAVLVGYLRARRTLVAHLRAETTLVEVAIAVDEVAVEIYGKVLIVLAELLDLLRHGLVATLRIILGVVRVRVVEALLPPTEEEHRIGVYALGSRLHAAIEVGIFEQVVAVLMFEDDALPRLHLLHPLRLRDALPPRRLYPSTILVGRLVPRAVVEREDIGVVRPCLAVEAVWVLEQTVLWLRKFALCIRIDAHAVPCILDERVVATDIKTLVLACQQEEVHRGVTSVVQVALTEVLVRAHVRVTHRLREYVLHGIGVVATATMRHDEGVILRQLRIVEKRVVQLADYRVLDVVGYARCKVRLVALQRHG